MIRQYRLSSRLVILCEEVGINRQNNNLSNGIASQKMSDVNTDASINFLGVKGEYVTRRALNLGGIEKVLADKPDYRGDIELPSGEWVEVKTRRKPFYDFGIEGADIDRLFHADYGVLVWQMPMVNVFRIVGWCDKSQFIDGMVWMSHLPKPSWVLPWQQLQPFDVMQKRVNQQNQPIKSTVD